MLIVDADLRKYQKGLYGDLGRIFYIWKLWIDEWSMDMELTKSGHCYYVSLHLLFCLEGQKLRVQWPAKECGPENVHV